MMLKSNLLSFFVLVIKFFQKINFKVFSICFWSFSKFLQILIHSQNFDLFNLKNFNIILYYAKSYKNYKSLLNHMKIKWICLKYHYFSFNKIVSKRYCVNSRNNFCYVYGVFLTADITKHKINVQSQQKFFLMNLTLKWS